MEIVGSFWALVPPIVAIVLALISESFSFFRLSSIIFLSLQSLISARRLSCLQ